MISEENIKRNRQERFDRVMEQVYAWWCDENFESSDLNEEELEDVFSEVIPTMLEMIELRNEESGYLQRGLKEIANFHNFVESNQVIDANITIEIAQRTLEIVESLL